MNCIRVQIMDESDMNRALSRMAHQMIERNPDMSDLAIIGIRCRGIPISKRLVESMAQFVGVWPEWGSLDIESYHDDQARAEDLPIVRSTNILFPLRGRTVILVDDVLNTGLTARAAIDAIMDIGRPKSIQLAALIDRGHRKLPITADFVGKSVPTSSRENIEVHVNEIDGMDDVVLIKPK